MSICKTELQELFSENPEKWAKDLKVKTSLIYKLLSDKGTIHFNTAETITKAINQIVGYERKIENFFELSELRGYEVERTVTYTYGVGRPVSDEEWISYFRYIFEGRLRV